MLQVAVRAFNRKASGGMRGWKIFKNGTNRRTLGQQSYLLSNRSLCNAVAPELTRTDFAEHQKKPSLIIFDKDGTLICFHSMWTPWALKTAEKLKLASGLTSVDIADKVYQLLGFNPQTLTVYHPGLLAEATMPEIRCRLVQLLIEHGVEAERADEIVNSVWELCDTASPENVKALHDIKMLFEQLRSQGIKIAICTADSRIGTETVLKQLDLLQLVDMVVCGDDVETEPKPSPHNALKICKALDIDPKEAFVVGDTLADMLMGRRANLGKTIAVLSGVAKDDHLRPHADHVIASVAELIPVVIKHVGQLLQIDKPVTSKQKLPSDVQLAFPQRQFVRHFAAVRRLPQDLKPTHVIVGAGSAGCVLANRLTEDPNNRVLLLEAGPEDSWWNWKIHMPAALMYNLCNDKYNWFYHTEPQPHMNNRTMYWPRGRVWGGSSSLNAMVYIRGHPMDYDRWGREGAAGWTYAACLPYFKKAQCHESGTNAYRGGLGPLHVMQGRCENPLFKAFIQAGIEAGYGYTSDINGYRQEGVGPMDMTIWKGRRWSVSQAYLRPILSRPNLFIMSRVLASRLLFDKQRAVGIEVTVDKQPKQIFTEQEIILCGGAINTPQLLQLSGVGDANFLKSLDIPVVHHLPGVGANLQDHLEMYVKQACTQPITLYDKSWRFPHNMVRIGLQWLLFRTGEGASSHLEAGGFVSSDENVQHPDIQIHFLNGTVDDHGRKIGSQHAYQMHIGPMRPTSRGWIQIRSKNPHDHPRIQPNYLTTEQDRKEFRACIRVARNIFGQKAFDPFRGPELAPGADVQSDTEMDAFVRAHADSAYHPSCTCKMGTKNDPLAVVDGRTMNVWGMEGLRVVDASVMPSVVSGNLNAPVVMLAERAADLVRGTVLNEQHVPIWNPLLHAGIKQSSEFQARPPETNHSDNSNILV